VSRGPALAHLRLWLAGLLLGAALGSPIDGAAASDATAALDLAISTAETSLQNGDISAAQTHYREALFEGWLLIGRLQTQERRLPEAREALANASAAASGDPTALQSLARALAAAGQRERAAQTLDQAARAAPTGDAETAFLLGAEYLWLKELGGAERLFAQALRARPLASLHVLIGRAYRDAGEYARARAELHAALDQDPTVRHAHYYLGMVTLADPTTGPDRLDGAIAEFREELKLAPEDALANDQLGVALLEAGRAPEALAVLQRAVGTESRSLYVYHLGRCELALERPADAAGSLRRALVLAAEQGAGAAERGKIHYQLGLALRKLGSVPEAATHLAEARRMAAEDDPGSGGVASGVAVGTSEAGAPIEPSSLAKATVAEREELLKRVRVALARAYFNLGVIEAQKQRFAEAAERFEKAAALDPEFPQVQSSLGIAYFNARQFDKATSPLARAVAAQPAERGLKRMLAMAWLNTQAYAKAAELLRVDPDRERDPSLQFAYGLALANSERTAEAIEHLEAAAQLAPDDAGIHYELGRAYQKLGRLDRAEQEFALSRRLKEKD
jgi:tetratricopeptide (TPR) repeat protein